MAAHLPDGSDRASPRGERTRERIVAAGFDCIRREGIRRLAMDEVAKMAGVSRAGLYRHFANKQALVDEVLESNARRFRLELTAALAGKRTLAAKIGAAARFGTFPPHDLLRLGLSETDPTSLAVLLTAGAHGFLARATRFWEPHVVIAQERGEVDGAIDAAQAAEWIARSFFSLATTSPVTFDATNPKEVERYARRFILNGLSSK